MEDQLKIMVLDDEPIVCKRLKPALEKLGFEVDTFTHSVEAIQEIKEDRLRHRHYRSKNGRKSTACGFCRK